MTPTRDGAPPQGGELVARVVPLRRVGGPSEPVVQVVVEPLIDVFDDPDAPEAGLTPIEVFVAPNEGLAVPQPPSGSVRERAVTIAVEPAPGREQRRVRPGWSRWLSILTASLVLSAAVVALAVSGPQSPRPRTVTRHAPAKVAGASTLAVSRAAAEAAARERSARAAALRAAHARAAARRVAAKRHVSATHGGAASVVATPPASPGPSTAAANPCSTAGLGQLGC